MNHITMIRSYIDSQNMKWLAIESARDRQAETRGWVVRGCRRQRRAGAGAGALWAIVPLMHAVTASFVCEPHPKPTSFPTARSHTPTPATHTPLSSSTPAGRWTWLSWRTPTHIRNPAHAHTPNAPNPPTHTTLFNTRRQVDLAEVEDPRVDVCLFCLPPHRLRAIDLRCAPATARAAES